MKKELRQRVHRKYNGHCAYCGKIIEYKDMQVDHIISKGSLGSTNDPENLNPSCRRCNFYKSDMSLEMFRRQMKTLHERIRKIFIYKLGEDYGIITITPFDGKFYFERTHDETHSDSY